METEEITAKITPFLQKYWLPLSPAVLGLIFFGYGLILLFTSKTQVSREFSQGDSTPTVTSQTANLIAIDI